MKSIRILLLAMLVGAAATTSVRAESQIFLEPEVGFRSIGGDVADILDPGASIGGTIGFHVSPMFALTGHLDFGLHPASPDNLVSLVIDGGGSLNAAVGGRFYPLAESTGPMGIFVGGSLGRTAVAWKYTDLARSASPGLSDGDGIGGWAISLEGGGHYLLTEKLHIGAGLRFSANTWADKTSEGIKASDFTGKSADFKGNSVTAFGVLSFHL